MRKAEMLWSAVLMVVAVVVIVCSVRIGFGWEASGIQAGFCPFWMGVILLISEGVIVFRGLRKKGEDDFFVNIEGMWEVVKITFTSVLLTIGIVFAGVYIATIVYAVLFSRWLGRHRWPAVIAFAVIATLAIFYGMEKGLKIPLPKSPLYTKGLFLF